MMDKKGKIFGKVNLIDLFVVILILAIVVVLAWRVLGGSGNSSAPSTATTLTYTVAVNDVSSDIYESILNYMPDDQLMASGELLPAYVTDVVAEVQEPTTLTTNGNTIKRL